MALNIMQKIKPVGNFPAVDAEDVLMPDGKRLNEFSIEVDESFDVESKNPVMNKTITAAMTQALEVMGGIQQNITALQNNALPTVTTEDNDKILQVVNGKFEKVSLADSAVKTYIDEYINSALEGEY